MVEQRSKTKIEIVTPGRIVLAGFCLAIVLVCCSSWLFGMSEHFWLDEHEVSEVELNAQLRSIERRLAAGEDAMQLLVLPEGKLFANSFYGYALVNMSLSRKSDVALQKRCCEKLETLLAKIAAMQNKEPFSFNAEIKPKGGIILAGHANLLRAGYIIIGGKNAQIIDDFHKGSLSLSDAFLARKVPFPECYPGYTWAEDAIYALESLRLHDVLFKTDYSKARNAWLNWMKSNLDPESGLMVTQVDPNSGEIADGSRGCALSWALSFMPQLDADFAHGQFKLFRQKWFIPFAGMVAIREWYEGREKPTMFHAGPVVLGLGAAASGIGIATCRSNGDYASWHRLLRALETLGFPLWNPSGEKSYFWGNCLLADVLALWGKTICRWDGDGSPPVQQAFPANSQIDSFFITFFVACILSAAVVLFFARRLVRLTKDRSLHRAKWSNTTKSIFAAQIFAVLGYLVVPAISWIQVLIIMLVIDLLEELIIRPKIVSAIFKNMESTSSAETLQQ